MCAKARERKEHVALRWWRYRKIHRAFGPKFWSFVVGAAPLDGALEAFWGELGFVVIQGYGLTETAPIVTLNHPFGTKKGSVGKAIAGVEVKVAPDGEILVRGENVTKGYYNADEENARAFEDGWFHTGDIGEIGDDRQLYIRGRKKEMIVTPEGLNVFPEDVEKVLNVIPGVRDSAVVGVPIGSEERVHAVLVLDPGIDVDAIVRQANAQLDDHQKIRRALLWPEPELPRTDGTRKLKRAAIREWVKSGGATPRLVQQGTDALAALVAKYAGRENLSPHTTLQELGLSSLDRVELMVALEDTFQTRIDEGSFASAQDLGQLRSLVERRLVERGPSGRAGRLPRLDAQRRRARRTPRQPRDLDPSAGAGVCLDADRGARASPRSGRPRDLRLQPPEFHGWTGDHGGAAAAVALPAGAGDGKGNVHPTFLSGGAQPPVVVHQQPQLLPRGPAVQRVSSAAARSGRASDAALHRRAARRSAFAADLSGRQAVRNRRHRRIPSRHRHDRLQARGSGRAGAHRRSAGCASRRVAHGSAGTRASRVRRPAEAGWRRL